ncbi:tripartite tricarboxylate transporter substrate binding protein [Petroclostridium sp. X23]|uniref:tripartite tricarboxylate transporter substrate binding protein n=1 Tax=Petroclostridium sp. X23 TaxID=3045146 RepID=UPI0024AE6F99|nr:tripartite tricarboxylate transporter substrate binding protein [Petroclostridium sp. X23]WHH60354.1 tripartite tricarboxylate transporter substrate binding protein [Petroclostridium sp. X23]
MRKIVSLVAVGMLTLSLFAGCAQKPDVKTEEPAKTEQPAKTEEPAKAWVPEKEIEFVVPSSAGGGSDLNARTIADLAQKNNFTPKSFMVVNKPGGSGAVSFSYVYGKKGDPNTLMILHSGQVMSAIVNKSPVKADMLTYVGTVAVDELVFAVKKDSKYKDIESIIKAAKENPDTVKIGGSQRGNGDHLSFLMFNKETGSKAAYVQFNSSGEVMSSLLGGHIDVGIFNPAESNSQIQAGELIPVASFSSERLSGVFKDTPTFKELGYDKLELSEVRAIAGPPNMSAEALKFYEDLLKKVTETDEWKQNYIEKGFMTNKYLTAEETKKFFTAQSKLYEEMFSEVDLSK